MATPEADKAVKPRNLHRSYVATPKDAAANRAWWVVDATGKPLGRLEPELLRRPPVASVDPLDEPVRGIAQLPEVQEISPGIELRAA